MSSKLGKKSWLEEYRNQLDLKNQDNSKYYSKNGGL